MGSHCIEALVVRAQIPLPIPAAAEEMPLRLRCRHLLIPVPCPPRHRTCILDLHMEIEDSWEVQGEGISMIHPGLEESTGEIQTALLLAPLPPLGQAPVEQQVLLQGAA